LFHFQDFRKFHDVVNRKGRDVLFDVLQTIDVLVDLLLGQYWRLEEPTETVDEFLKLLLVLLSISSVLSLSQLLRCFHLVNQVSHILVQFRQLDGVCLHFAVMYDARFVGLFCVLHSYLLDGYWS